MAKRHCYDRRGDVMDKSCAVILGGGRGTRLYPLTKLRAKPAVPLCGRYRLIDIPLSNCIHSGMNRIVVLTQFNSHSLNRHIGNTYKFDDFTEGYVAILAAEQTLESRDWFQGTADAVRQHLEHIASSGDRHYIILAGDHLYRMDYRSFMQTHLDRNADITVAALPVSQRDAQGFGVMQVRKNARIARFVEKPQDAEVLDSLVTPEKVFDDFGLKSEGKPYLASMGIYIFRAEVLQELLRGNPDWLDFGKELLPGALKSHRIFAHMFSGFWEDIGTVRSYFDVSMAMTTHTPPFNFHEAQRPIYTHARMLPGAKMIDTNVVNCIVCSGSTIERARISKAIVGIRSVIQPGVHLKNVVMLGADCYEDEAPRHDSIPMGIGADSKITNAIIDHNVHIGANVVIHGSKRLVDMDTDNFSIRDGVVVVHKNAVIPDGTVIE